MRIAPFAVTLLLAAAPVLAAPPRAARPSAEQAVRALQDPMAQELATGVVDQLIGIVLDTRVGPVAALTDPRDYIRPTDTLADLKRRDDPQFDRRLHADTRRAVGTMAAVAGGAMAQTAELRRTVARLQAALGPLVAALAGPPAADE